MVSLRLFNFPFKWAVLSPPYILGLSNPRGLPVNPIPPTLYPKINLKKRNLPPVEYPVCSNPLLFLRLATESEKYDS